MYAVNLVRKYEKELINIVEFKGIFDCLFNDEFLNNNYFPHSENESGNIVPLYGKDLRRNELRELFFHFIIYYTYLYLDFSFKEDIFLDVYYLFEYYICTRWGDKKLLHRVPLLSFEMEGDYLRLVDGVVIRKFANHERFNNDHIFRPKKHEIFMLELSSFQDLKEDIEFPISLQEERLELIIDALLLYKEGVVSYRGVFDLLPRFDYSSSRLYSGGSYTKFVIPARYSNYILNQSDMQYFKDFYESYTKLFAGSNSSIVDTLNIAIKRFSKSIQERELEDKIIDLSVAIECLFSNDTQELSHKLSLRICTILGNNSNERNVIFGFMKEIYNLRSKIVHGGVNYEEGIKMNQKRLHLRDIYLHFERMTRLCIQRYLNLLMTYTSKECIIMLLDKIIIEGHPSSLQNELSGPFTNHFSKQFVLKDLKCTCK